MSVEDGSGNARDLVVRGAKWCIGGAAGAAGGLAGWFVNGLEGAYAGAVVGGGISGSVRASLTTVLDDVASRALSSRQSRRVSVASFRVLNQVFCRMAAGEPPRDDGFFDPNLQGDERSPAEELFEGALIKCQNEHEEKKTKFIENIVANTVFDASVSAVAANSLMSIASRLTFRQYCILALLSRHEEFNVDRVNLGTRLELPSYASRHTMFLQQEITDLYSNGLLDRTRGAGSTYLSGLGELACKLMGVKEIEIEELITTRSNMP